MALSPLATVADLEARGVTVADGAEATAVAAFLDTASAIVRDAAGGPISETTGTVVLKGTSDAYLYLPSRPVTNVASVTDFDGNPITDYRLVDSALVRRCGWTTCHPWVELVNVTYTAGYATVPADVVDLVCRLAARQLVAYRESGDGTGMADRLLMQERIGDYSVMYAAGATDTSFSDIELPKYLRDRLSARYGCGSAVVVRYR